MGFFSSPKKPKVQPPPKLSDKESQAASADVMRQRAMAQSTVLTNQSGYGNVGTV